MTLDQFLDLLPLTGGDWFISPEGYLRRFLGPIQEGAQIPWEWPVSAVARLAGRNYSLLEWRRCGAFLRLSEHDLEALKGADQRHPDHVQLRAEMERRLGIAEEEEKTEAQQAQDAQMEAIMQDLRAPWQQEAGKEEQLWTDYLKKEDV